MSNLGMSIDDIAFAWSFSTGRVTGDLVDVRRGLYGEGPFKKLATEFRLESPMVMKRTI